MSLKAVTEDGIKRNQEKIGKLKEEIHDLEQFRSERAGHFWQKLKPKIERSVRANQEKLNAILDSQPGFATGPEGERLHPESEYLAVKQLRGAVCFGEYILREVEQAEAVIASKNEQIAALREEIKKAQVELGVS